MPIGHPLRHPTRVVFLALPWLFLALSAACCAEDTKAPPPAEAKTEKAAPKEKRPGDDRRTTRELLEQVMMARLSKELELDDEQTILFVRRFSELRQDIQKLHRERAEKMRALRETVRAGKDTGDIEAHLDAVRKQDRAIFDARQALGDTLGADLTPWQRGKLFLVLGDFENDLRKLVQQARDKAKHGLADDARRQAPHPAAKPAGDKAAPKPAPAPEDAIFDPKR